MFSKHLVVCKNMGDVASCKRNKSKINIFQEDTNDGWSWIIIPDEFVNWKKKQKKKQQQKKIIKLDNISMQYWIKNN